MILPRKRGRPMMLPDARLYRISVRIGRRPFLKLEAMKKEKNSFLRSVIEDATKNLPDVAE
jgi:hypothetical protein